MQEAERQLKDLLRKLNKKKKKKKGVNKKKRRPNKSETNNTNTNTDTANDTKSVASLDNEQLEEYHTNEIEKVVFNMVNLNTI
jgi:Tfp pilus assembly protein PilP